MSSHPCDTGKVAFKCTGGTFVYKMPFWGMAKWPPIGGWLLIRVAGHSRFYCINVIVRGGGGGETWFEGDKSQWGPHEMFLFYNFISRHSPDLETGLCHFGTLEHFEKYAN